ncbi:MBL fold metallo-hydrolase [Thermocaproicibacter melissae]|uniref:MBL fold metallo-hydrolase n=1 Tax=Thermocaproicibacter melissae TaxID=2966552 RepID=UPI0024B1FAD9|nr:MBL fold metallo-hydrolase [Thermocaproicibacter melissae]WBY63452.1 MBL fold metallo-hydrolase [Thermocaproicibacter melissae]
MQITKISGGPLPTNCYLLKDDETGKSAVIDPGFESEELSELVRKDGNVEAILLTHGHFDHISGVRKIWEETNAKIYLPTDEQLFVTDGSLNLAGMFFGESVPPFHVDVPLSDGQTVNVGKLEVKVLMTPGHTAGSCCFLVEDAIFSGDTLMKLSCGRTDFPTGNYSQLLNSLHRLGELPGDYRVFPGHGSATTLDYERRNNSYMGIR